MTPQETGYDDDALQRAQARAWHEYQAAHPLSTLAHLRAMYARDFIGFCELLEILPKDSTHGPIQFRLTQIQRTYCINRTIRDIILKARQVMISTIELARDLWWFLINPGSAVRIVCQSITDHGPKNDFSKRLNIMIAALRKKGLELTLEAEAVGRWLLAPSDGGSVLEIIEAGASLKAADKKGRGGTTQRLHVTELAFFEHAGASLRALRQTVPALGSEIVFESTPNGVGSEGQEGQEEAGGAYFHRAWTQAEQGTNGFRPHFFAWYENSENQTPLFANEVIEPSTERESQLVVQGITKAQLKWYRAQVAEMGQDTVDQEYPSDPHTCFLVSGRAFFDRKQTEKLLIEAKDFVPNNRLSVARPGAVGTLTVFYEPEPGLSYIVASDTSEGTGSDRGTAQVWERGSGRHMATIVGQFKPAELAHECERLGYAYGTAMIAVERNMHGHAVIQELERADPPTTIGKRKRKYPKIFHDYDDKPGWITHQASRASALSALEQVHRTGQWSTRCVETLREFRTFLISKLGKAEGAPGSRDDLVMTSAIAWSVLGRPTQGSRREAGPGWGGGYDS